jgi:hypothetical protein
LKDEIEYLKKMVDKLIAGSTRQWSTGRVVLKSWVADKGIVKTI